MMVELGNQRLIVSQELGTNFALLLENSPRSEEPRKTLIDLAARVNDRLFTQPQTQIIGTELNKKSILQHIITSLNRQMGLPQELDLKDLRARLVGRENNFILVFPGANQLPEKTKKKIAKKIAKLKIPIFWEE